MKLNPRYSRVQPNIAIRQKRLLPDGLLGSISVRTGQEVSAVQIVARSEQELGYHITNAADMLSISPNQLSDYLDTDYGARVRAGTPILRIKRRLARDQLFNAPIDGTFEDIQNGYVLIRRAPKEIDLRAMLPGWVVGIVPERGVVIETQGALIDAAWNSGLEGNGKLNLLSTSPGGQTKREQITGGVQGSIVAIGHISTPQIIRDAEDYGARGIIAGSMSVDIYRMHGRFSIPIALTEGIGRYPMAQPVFDLLEQHNGHEISILDSSYSDINRPTIILPNVDGTPDRAALNAHTADVQIGQSVRILAPPYIGKLGRVKTVYPHPQATEHGFQTVGADVIMEDGSTVFVPDRNLDIIL